MILGDCVESDLESTDLGTDKRQYRQLEALPVNCTISRTKQEVDQSFHQTFSSSSKKLWPETVIPASSRARDSRSAGI